MWYSKWVKLTLSGQPLSTQHCYLYTARSGSVRGYMKAACVTLKEQWQWEAKSQWRGAPLEGPVSVKMALYHGDHRKRDIDNFNKLVFDALAGIAFLDDNQVMELTITKEYDKERPRVELELSTPST